MKICFVIGSMRFSGAEKVLGIIASGLVENGHNVSTILLEQNFDVLGNENGIDTYGAKATGNKFTRLFNRWNYIRKNIKTINPDVVISFGSVCNVNMLASLLFNKVPKIICERNDPNYDPRTKFDRNVRWILYRLANGYVFQTEEIGEYFKKITKNKKTAIIPNPIIDSNIRWNINNIEKRIVTVARLDDFQKNHYTMFDAFRLFHAHYQDYILDVYGAGPDEDNYKEYINKNNLYNCIFLKGKTNNPLKTINNANVFLLTSKFEGMPNALMEAFSIGIPCISTNCGGGGAKFLFSLCDCKEGLVEVNNARQIANKLCEFISNEKLLNKVSQNEVKINTLLEKRIIIEEWIQFILQVIEKK